MSLTVKPRTHHEGERLYDTWEIANSTDHPVVLLTVEVVGADTYDDSTAEFKAVRLTPGDASMESGVMLSFDDDEQQSRLHGRRAWAGVRIPPASTLQATVLNNRELRITSRTEGQTSDDSSSSIGIRGNV